MLGLAFGSFSLIISQGILFSVFPGYIDHPQEVIEPEKIGCSFIQEVLLVLKGFDFIELILDESMDSFHIGLPCMRAWGDGGVGDTVKGLNGFGEAGVVPCVPSTDEFGSVVGLGAGAFKMDLAGF